ncbi:hypothetical protein AN958_09744 [Leucoagaricus sp. SymC.cos]|nr:hypothetical protein AN958_09744 [Leucoagaricus sp. SymC.cos]
MPRANIVLFGESGSGKSSIVNMLSDNEHVADTSCGAQGCTFESRSYDVNVLGKPVTLWDTAGLDEGDAGRVPKSEAIVLLYKLLRSLSDVGGVSLLMFVMRQPRLKSSTPQNWKLFKDIICQSQVPIVIAITGCELEENMDRWWWTNKGTFQAYGISPVGFACITASRGRRRGNGYLFDEKYAESRGKIQSLMRSTSLRTPWCVPPAEWFKTVVQTTYNTEDAFFWFKTVEGEALQKLITVCGMSPSEARELAEKLRRI